MSKIIYGPQGCGKTRNAKALMEHFGLKHLIDDGEDKNGNSWSYGDPVPEDTLILTGDSDAECELSFLDAMSAMASASK